jgi:hypothetical protein
MTNLLAEAIACDDPDRAARIIRDALGIESDDVVNYCFPDIVAHRHASSAPATSASGSRPRPAIPRRDRTPPLLTRILSLGCEGIVSKRLGSPFGPVALTAG